MTPKPTPIMGYCPIESDWKRHKAEMSEIVDKIDSLDNHLAILPEMANYLRNIDRNLVGPATSKKQVPAAMHIIIVAILSVIISVLVLKDTAKTFEMNKSGFKLGNGAPAQIQ